MANETIIRIAAFSLCDKVSQMRQAQKNYYAQAHGSPEKQSALRVAKQLEAEVDKMIIAFKPTINNLYGTTE